MKLPGRIAVVTSPGSGIGRATVQLFGREGARVLTTNVNGAAGQDRVKNSAIACDSVDPVAKVNSVRLVTASSAKGGAMITKLVRALFGSEAGSHCRRCKEPLHPHDEVGAKEGVCLPCRLDPGRTQLAA